MSNEIRLKKILEQTMMTTVSDYAIKEITSEMARQWHHGYKTGRKDAMEEAARCVRQCTDVDPTLAKIADAILEL